MSILARQVRRWEQLESVDLHADPFVMGQQACCIRAGCPFRPGTIEYQEFQRGFQAQSDWYERQRSAEDDRKES